MKKGFKFQFVVRAVVNGRKRHFHSVSYERSLQVYFFFKNCCSYCTAAVFVDVLNGLVLRRFDDRMDLIS